MLHFRGRERLVARLPSIRPAEPVRPASALDGEHVARWLAGLAGRDAWDAVREKLAEGAEGAAEDPWLAAEVLAAAELIAAGRGRPRRVLPEAAEAFLDRVEGWPTDADAALALDVVAVLAGEAVGDAERGELAARLAR